MKIKKNGLSFTINSDGSYVCEDLFNLPQVFEDRYGVKGEKDAEIHNAVTEHIDVIRRQCGIRLQNEEEYKSMPEDVQKQKGGELFDEIVFGIKPEGENSFQRFLFWFEDWWYYNSRMTLELRKKNTDSIYESIDRNIRRFIFPILPDAIKDVVGYMEIKNTASAYGHFALLFIDRESETRRIVTDSQLFEIRGVKGYIYLDINSDGKPITRSVCDRGGKRAFFDGVHLMSHDSFQTCAPKTVIISGGYKVNSTECTIVNGMLLDLVDVDDKVAHTKGCEQGWFSPPTFSSEEHTEMVRLSKESGFRMRVEDGRVFLDDKELKPRGIFLPSRITLLESGFSLYDWSDFHEIHGVRYSHALVVDDSEEWINKVNAEFGKEIENLESFRTSNAEDALLKILYSNPEVVFLDIQLTDEEKFDGLWIANKLAKSGFKGDIFITSGYGEEALRAMQKLIKRKTLAPGKNLEKIRNCLYGKGDK